MTAAVADPVEVESTEEPTPTGPEIVQPADVVTQEEIEAAGGLQLFAPGVGALALDPRQVELTVPQKAALIAIGIDTVNDPGIVPHVRPFIHMCQTRGLDPYRREAYLIGRGKGNGRKYTMQVGIDGYLNMAQGTGRYRRVLPLAWTGKDDDEKSYRLVDDTMVPLWWGKWPVRFGEPGAARARIEHYDERGDEVIITEVVADWEMYAPYNDRWAGGNKVIDPATGKPFRDLSDMWVKGGPHMLAKCAIAQGIRRAFPGATAGTYVVEEMHQADAIERRRIEAERVDRMREVVIDLKAAKSSGPSTAEMIKSRPIPTPVQPKPEPVEDADGDLDAVLASPSRPLSVGEVIEAEVIAGNLPEPQQPEQRDAVDAELVEEPTAEVDEEQRKQWLLAELALQAELLATTVPALARLWVANAKKNPEDATADELQGLVASKRELVVFKLRQANTPEATAKADTYAQVEPNQYGPVDWLVGSA